ncbi:MAG: MBL fold metallo-hydrolase [archaeon]|nr:MBL fold metallo-hydrolase [archaeon]
MTFTKITENICVVGGGNLSSPEDAMSYVINSKNSELILIDCGINSKNTIENNIKDAGYDLKNLCTLILTHCHIDHTGSAYDFEQSYPNLKIICHEWEKPVLEGNFENKDMTAASWYGVKYRPIKVDLTLKKEEETHNIGGTDLHFIHTPGHTPGSISIIVEDEGKKILFGQDIHGPFMREFNSNIQDWANSMKLLISKNCDILAEGHYGIYKSPEKVKKFIQSHLKQNGF